MIYYIKSNRGIFVYDSSKENLFESIYVITGNRRLRGILNTMLRASPFFIDNNKKQRKLPEDREIFFREYIPRVLKLEGKVIHTDDSIIYKKDDNKHSMIYFQEINGNRFYFNKREPDLKGAFWVDGPEILKEMFRIMLKAPKFLANDKELHITNNERKLFFNDYIPRVFGTPSKKGILEMVEI